MPRAEKAVPMGLRWQYFVLLFLMKHDNSVVLDPAISWNVSPFMIFGDSLYCSHQMLKIGTKDSSVRPE